MVLNNKNSINNNRWMIPYADLITLLMVFFIVLYSISNLNQKNYKILTENLMKEFNSNFFLIRKSF